MYNSWPDRETWAAANWLNAHHHGKILNMSLELARPRTPGWQKRARRRVAAYLRFLARQAGDRFTPLVRDRRDVDWPMIADRWLIPLVDYKSPYKLPECPPGMVKAIDFDGETGRHFSHFAPLSSPPCL